MAVRGAEAPLGVGDLTVELGEPDGEEVAGQCFVVVRWWDLLDLVPQRAEQLRGALDRHDGFAVRAGVDRRGGRVSDPQDAGTVQDQLGERDRRPRHLVGRARIRPGDRVQQCGAVPHGARDDTLGHHPEHLLPGLGAVRAQTTARLQPHEPVAGGRYPDGAATVVGAGGRDDA